MLKYSFYLSFLVFIFGLIFRMVQWVRYDLDANSARQSKLRRLIAIGESFWNHLISAQALIMFKAFVWEGLFQASIARSSKLRWLAHMSIFWGFILLLLFHALDDYISARIFSDYASTLNPFLLLRNLLGAFVLFGIVIALYRRRRQFVIKRISNKGDLSALWLIAGIIITGFLLEAVQIISENQFDLMVNDYMMADDDSEIAALRTYWAKYYSVSFAQPLEMTDENLSMGESLHMDSCASCHSQPHFAFVSHNLSQFLKPVATILNTLNADSILLVIHYMLCFIGLAWLPFGKMFHIISTPLHYCVNASTLEQSRNSTAQANRNIVALDACTHCGVCSQNCAVEPINRVIENSCILPSEKIKAVRTMAAGAHPVILEDLFQGNSVCTSCNRCTQNCPSGIPLLDIWQTAKKELHDRGLYRSEETIIHHTAYEWADLWKSQEPFKKAEQSFQLFISDDPETYEECVQCSVCTQVCPIVSASSTGGKPLDLTPQQVMNLLRIGLTDKALGTQMVWMCATCYMCQEHCPQHIPVADIFYELRNKAHQQLIAKKTGDI